jgi:hypothetical protein
MFEVMGNFVSNERKMMHRKEDKKFFWVDAKNVKRKSDGVGN